MGIILTISVLANLVLGYLLYAFINKYDKLIIFTETYLTFIVNLYLRFKDTHSRLKDVDKRGSFQADDEVGFIFTEINTNIEELHQFLEKYVNENQKKEDAK